MPDEHPDEEMQKTVLVLSSLNYERKNPFRVKALDNVFDEEFLAFVIGVAWAIKFSKVLISGCKTFTVELLQFYVFDLAFAEAFMDVHIEIRLV
jgi:hypothetical protein